MCLTAVGPYGVPAEARPAGQPSSVALAEAFQSDPILSLIDTTRSTY